MLVLHQEHLSLPGLHGVDVERVVGLYGGVPSTSAHNKLTGCLTDEKLPEGGDCLNPATLFIHSSFSEQL